MSSHLTWSACSTPSSRKDALEAPYIRLFSFFIPEGTDPDSRRDEVLNRMSALAEAADGSDVILVHENEKEIYGDIPRRCLDIVASVSSPKLQLAWDRPTSSRSESGPSRGVRHAASTCRLHPDQGRAALGWVGCRRWRWRRRGAETVRALRADGFDGFFSLEPHLGEYTAFGALSGPESFTESWKAFTGILTSEGIQYA